MSAFWISATLSLGTNTLRAQVCMRVCIVCMRVCVCVCRLVVCRCELVVCMRVCVCELVVCMRGSVCSCIHMFICLHDSPIVKLRRRCGD